MSTSLHRFTFTTHLHASQKDVAAFHRDTRALKRLTPPPIFVQIHKVQPLSEGSLSEFTMWMGPIPVHWLALHGGVDPLTGFTDEQIKGPFTRWVHRHEFRALSDNQSVIIDEVEADFGSGLWFGLISRFMWLGLPLMFAYRSWVLRRAFGK